MQKDDKGKGPYGVRVTCANMQMKYNNILSSLVLMILLLLPNLFSLQISFAQQIITQDQDLVTYSGQSNFIKEFEVPVVKEKGLRGITTDAQGNVWFYHSTNKTSTAIKLEPDTGKFTAYDIKGDTVVDNAVINLAGGQLVFDDKRNVVWFTDVRTNSIGRLDVKSEKVELIKIPTPRSGPLGIVLSPHDGGKSIWFAEITGDKIARLDPESNNRIIEYSTGENSGPSLLTFDSKGILWTSLSYANSILRAETSKLVPGSSAAGMSTITLSKPDTFSPFGIAIVDVADANDDTASRGNQKIFVSDHGSSRVISADVPQNDGSNTISLNPQSYMSYWTSPSSAYPTTLATQIVTDKQGKNIYFPQHIGNRISKIDTKTGIMTEYDIPTGPLSTTLFAAVSDDGKKVWFTEWASNKVGNLDTTVPVPFDLEVRNNNQTIITLDKNGSKSLDILLKAEGNNGNLGVSIDEVGLAVVGMSDSGLKGVTYTAQPQRIDLEQNPKAQAQIKLNVEDNNNARPGQYTVMVRATAAEKVGSQQQQQILISVLYPISVTLDVPQPASNPSVSNNNGSSQEEKLQGVSLQELVRYLALSAVAGLIGFIVYRRIKGSKI